MLRLREYETIYIMRPDISDVDADRITDRMRTVIRSYDGKIVEVNNWGKRRLAYEIAKHQKGIYVYWRYVGNTDAVRELERNLRMLEPVLRFLTVKLEDAVDGEAIVGLSDEQIPMRSEKARAEQRAAEAEMRTDSAEEEEAESDESDYDEDDVEGLDEDEDEDEDEDDEKAEDGD